MMLDPRDHGAGVDGLEDPILGPLADAHDPAEEEVPVGLETRFGEGDGQGLQEGVERWDDRPHGGRLLVAWGVSKTRLQPQVYRGSPPVSLPRNLRKFSKGTEKFWNEDQAETILQLRAAQLSEDGRLSEHLKKRPISPYRHYKSTKRRKTG